MSYNELFFFLSYNATHMFFLSTEAALAYSPGPVTCKNL